MSIYSFVGGSDLPHSFMVMNTGRNPLPYSVSEYSTLGGTSAQISLLKISCFCRTHSKPLEVKNEWKHLVNNIEGN